jgi:adenylate kinase
VRVALTGTPGTGKTTVADRLETDLEVIHLNEVVASEGLYDEVDEQRESKVVDVEGIREYLTGRDGILVESHLAHLVDADRVVVLRCHPEEIVGRLRERSESEESAEENAESEALDVILAEAVERFGRENVYEVDTTDREPEAVAGAVTAAITGEREPSAGEVSFVDYL